MENMLACKWFWCPGSTFGLVSTTCNVCGRWRSRLLVTGFGVLVLLLVWSVALVMWMDSGELACDVSWWSGKPVTLWNRPWWSQLRINGIAACPTRFARFPTFIVHKSCMMVITYVWLICSVASITFWRDSPGTSCQAVGILTVYAILGKF